jgi:hypothetical protein
MDAEGQIAKQKRTRATQGGSLAQLIPIPAAAFVTIGTSCSLTSTIMRRITILTILLGCARQITIGTIEV